MSESELWQIVFIFGFVIVLGSSINILGDILIYIENTYGGFAMLSIVFSIGCLIMFGSYFYGKVIK